MEKNYRLPKYFAEKWIAALRSGEYEQTQLQMFDGNKCYCALGLAAHLCGAPDDKINGSVSTVSIRLVEYDIPSELKNDRDLPLYLRIMTLNDRDNKSFPEIADWIEQNVELY